MSEAPAAVATAKPRRTFTPRSLTPKLSVDQARRQGHVARVAWEALREREAVMAFLNHHDAGLGGRPLDLAVNSDAGLERVRAMLASQPAVIPRPKDVP